MITAFGVVIVRNNRGIDAKCREQIQSVEALHILAHFVDLIDRNRGAPQSKGCSGCECDDAAMANLVFNDGGNICATPLPQGIRGRAWSRKDVVGIGECTKSTFNEYRICGQVSVVHAHKTRHGDIDIHRSAKIGNCSCSKLRSVFLKTIRSVQKNCAWR
ncbi:unannotated protein [freshwater metagenome]|uniref:Unannotated protein n=1 Tax=freshwater metagenome TaxID=449393 RepID=A0A6J6DM62_9ZZZZ